MLRPTFILNDVQYKLKEEHVFDNIMMHSNLKSY